MSMKKKNMQNYIHSMTNPGWLVAWKESCIYKYLIKLNNDINRCPLFASSNKKKYHKIVNSIAI